MTRFNFILPLYNLWLDKVFNHYLASSKRILRYIEIKPTDNVLDIGGGYGCIASIIRASTGANVVVLDPSERIIEKGKKKYSQVKFVLAQAEYLPFADHSFDVVIMIGMLHFVDNPELVVREAGRVLKKGGKLLISDINFANPLNHYLLKPIKTAVISKVSSFTPEEVDEILLRYNFQPQRHATSGLLVSAIRN